MRKIRVIYSDPYATECSSDEEESIELMKPTNTRICREFVAKSSSDVADSSSREDGPAKDGPICISQVINSAFAENRRSLGRKKHHGIKRTASGKWAVQITHPIEGTKIWLGSHNTIEEATSVYENKKLELALLSELIKQMNPDLQSAKHKRQRFLVGGLTILETTAGKWAAWTTDSVSNAKIWLGVYATPEEAVKSYCIKKPDVDSNCNPENLGFLCSGAPNIASPIDTDAYSFRRPGIKLTKTGKWGVTIHIPNLKCRHWLGSFDTLEEAEKVYDKKKAELEARSGSYNIAGSTAEAVNQECYSLGKVLFPDAKTTFVINSQGQRVVYKGIRLRESGRWSAESKDAIKGKNTHIGTFDTPEEAADAFAKRKRELDEMMSLKKQKCEGIAEAHNEGVIIPEANDDVGVKIKTEPNNASPSFTLEGENSIVTAVSSQNSDEGSNTNNNDKQIPGSDDEFGFSVINCYGELVGEYSRIDDELWLTGPGDYDEGDVNLYLDHKPFSYLSNLQMPICYEQE